MANHDIEGVHRIVVPKEGADKAASVFESFRDEGFFTTINNLDLSTASFVAIGLAVVLTCVGVAWFRAGSEVGTTRALAKFDTSGKARKLKKKHACRDQVDFRDLRKSRPEMARDDASRQIYLRDVSPDPKARPSRPDLRSEQS